MTDRDRIILLAEKVMGSQGTFKRFSKEHISFIHSSASARGVFLVFDHEKQPLYICGEISEPGRRWNPLESIADAFEMEAALPEEKRNRFVIALMKITDATLPEPRIGGLLDYWFFAHATPRQRCEAAIAALEGR